jgi:hypothetical protein
MVAAPVLSAPDAPCPGLEKRLALRPELRLIATAAPTRRVPPRAGRRGDGSELTLRSGGRLELRHALSLCIVEIPTGARRAGSLT